MNKPDRIASFQINHLTLVPGLYLSRRDRTVLTFDLRFTAPNRQPVLTTGVCHALEHLLATYLRFSDVAEQVVYFGPMGCRTGFYLLVWDTLDFDELREVLINAMRYVEDFRGVIPGATAVECGNYADMDLVDAQAAALAYRQVLMEGRGRSWDY